MKTHIGHLPAGMISTDYTPVPLWRNGAAAVKIVSARERMREIL
jgi:hypothetical protein